MQILIEGDNAANLTQDLRNWIRKAGIDGVTVELASGTSIPGTQGAELVTTLLLFLKTKVADELASTVKAWLRVKKPQKLKVTFKSKDKQITIDAENTTVDDALIHNLKLLFAND